MSTLDDVCKVFRAGYRHKKRTALLWDQLPEKEREAVRHGILAVLEILARAGAIDRKPKV